MRVVSPRPSHESWFSTPATPEGRWASALAVLALALGVLGESARRGDAPGPWYPLAFLAGLLGGVAAMIAFRHGERSLVAMFAFVPLLIGVSFGIAELLT